MNVVENEYHFLLVCPLYRSLRVELIPKYFRTWPNLNKFEMLLQTKNVKHLNLLGKYIHLALQKRSSSI